MTICIDDDTGEKVLCNEPYGENGHIFLQVTKIGSIFKKIFHNLGSVEDVSNNNLLILKNLYKNVLTTSTYWESKRFFRHILDTKSLLDKNI